MPPPPVSAARFYNTSQQWNGTPATVVLRDLDFQNPVEPRFLACSNRAVATCWRKFGTSQSSFSDCLYGYLVSSRLLPPEVAALSDQIQVDTSGAFAEGAALSCNLIEPGNNSPEMMSFY